MPAAPYELERADGAYSPVEIAIRRGLGQDTPVTGLRWETLNLHLERSLEAVVPTSAHDPHGI